MIRRKKRLKPPLPLAAMGDIAFLMIIFFMLSSNFIESTDKDLEMVESPDVEEVADPPNVSVIVDAEGTIYLMGAEYSAGGLGSAVESLLEGRKDRRVKLTVDKNLTKKQFFPVIEALNQAGATNVATALYEEGSTP